MERRNFLNNAILQLEKEAKESVDLVSKLNLEMKEIQVRINSAEEDLNSRLKKLNYYQNLLDSLTEEVPQSETFGLKRTFVNHEENDQFPREIVGNIFDMISEGSNYYKLAPLPFVSRKWAQTMREWKGRKSEEESKLVQLSIREYCSYVHVNYVSAKATTEKHRRDNEMFIWAWGKGCSGDARNILSYISSSADYSMFKNFVFVAQRHLLNPIHSHKLFQRAAQGGNLEILSFINQKLRPVYGSQTREWEYLPKEFILVSTKLFRFDMMEWCLENGGTFTGAEYSFAASGGSIQMLDWLVQQGCTVPTKDDPLWAKYKYPTISAIKGKHFHCLEWLLNSGWEWHGDEMSIVLSWRDVDTVLRLLSYGCPWGKPLRPTFDFWKDDEMKMLLKELGCDWPGLLDPMAVGMETNESVSPSIEDTEDEDSRSEDDQE